MSKNNLEKKLNKNAISVTNLTEKMEDINKLNRSQLLDKCKELNIKKYSSKNKLQLIELINDAINKNTNVCQNIVAENTPTLTCSTKIKDEKDDDKKDDDEKEKQLKFIDLFCGIGGFHQALHKLGAKCVLACDIDKECRTVYKDNYGIEPVSDVKKINEKTMPDFDILCGGFPCQAFSNGGKKKCFEDDRGLLFDEIIRIAKEKRPKFMFLENVKHILKVSGGEVIEYIKEKIKSIGYHLQLFQISPHKFGIPQQRERVYFVCIRNDIYNGNAVVLPEFAGKIKFEKFLDKKENIDKKYFIGGDLLNVLEAWDKMINIFEEGEKISPTIMINDAYKKYTQDDFDGFPDWKKDYISKNVPLIEKYKPEFDEWYKKNANLLQKREIYGKLEWQTGPIKKQDSIFNHFIQVRQSGIRVKKSQYFPTLVAISQIPIYGKEKRYITPRECARLQSFPDTFKLSEDDKKSYKQLGNSVNVDNVHTVISSTLKMYVNL
jgi:DNA (cytosine-5)-methyltransferase 1